MDWNNYNLGKYISYAFNAPKKYPSKPFLQKEETKDIEMTDEQMERVARINTLKLGGKVNYGNNT